MTRFYLAVALSCVLAVLFAWRARPISHLWWFDVPPSLFLPEEYDNYPAANRANAKPMDHASFSSRERSHLAIVTQQLLDKYKLNMPLIFETQPNKLETNKYVIYCWPNAETDRQSHDGKEDRFTIYVDTTAEMMTIHTPGFRKKSVARIDR